MHLIFKVQIEEMNLFYPSVGQNALKFFATLTVVKRLGHL